MSITIIMVTLAHHSSLMQKAKKGREGEVPLFPSPPTPSLSASVSVACNWQAC